MRLRDRINPFWRGYQLLHLPAVERGIRCAAFLIYGFVLLSAFTACSPTAEVPAKGAAPPFDASWVHSNLNPILSPAGWENTAVCEVAAVFGTGSLWRMWYRGGWEGSALAYATSSDGINWTKYALNPVFGSGGSGFSAITSEPRILRKDSAYYLYIALNSVSVGSSQSLVATSIDGITWMPQKSSISFAPGCDIWGNCEIWIEGSTWKRLQEEMFQREYWAIYYYTSSDGLVWNIGNDSDPLSTLQVHAGGMYGGPRFATVNGVLTPKFGGVYHLWYHAVNGAGNLPTDIYHATSLDGITWTKTSPNPVLTHLGSGFEFDQVAGPVVTVVDDKAYLYYDGDDNGKTEAKIGVAVAPAVSY